MAAILRREILSSAVPETPQLRRAKPAGDKDHGAMPRPRPSLAGTYLLKALAEFRSAGSSEALFREMDPWHREDSILGPLQRDIDARDRRLGHLRATLLFAALAAEGYANEFLASRLHGRALEAADRLSTVDKLVLGPWLAGLSPPLDYGTEPVQTLLSLFQARNSLVHPRPDEGVYAIELRPGEQRAYGPKENTRYLACVAHAAVLLHPLREDRSFAFPASRVWEERAVLESHVDAIGADLFQLPAQDAEPLRDLMVQMDERAQKRAVRARGTGRPGS